VQANNLDHEGDAMMRAFLGMIFCVVLGTAALTIAHSSRRIEVIYRPTVSVQVNNVQVVLPAQQASQCDVVPLTRHCDEEGIVCPNWLQPAPYQLDYKPMPLDIESREVW